MEGLRKQGEIIMSRWEKQAKEVFREAFAEFRVSVLSSYLLSNKIIAYNDAGVDHPYCYLDNIGITVMAKEDLSAFDIAIKTGAIEEANISDFPDIDFSNEIIFALKRLASKVQSAKREVQRQEEEWRNTSMLKGKEAKAKMVEYMKNQNAS